MPVYKSLKINTSTRLLIWKIDETFQELLNGINLTKSNQKRVNGMKSELHKKAFVAVRQLFKKIGYKDKDIVYDKFGKPHLKNGKFISISHSFNFCGLIISDENPVGIDIEKRRDKIVKIAHKFTPINKYKNITDKDLIRKLTVVWGAKESLYKIYGKKQLLFKEHIYIDNFELENLRTTGQIQYENKKLSYFISFFEFDKFTCVYAF